MDEGVCLGKIAGWGPRGRYLREKILKVSLFEGIGSCLLSGSEVLRCLTASCSPFEMETRQCWKRLPSGCLGNF